MIKVLVADDEFLIRWSICELLRGEGFSTRMAEDGFGALSAIKDEVFDYIITDIYMPGVDGWKVLDYAKRVSPRTRIVIITARGSPENRKKAMEVGAFGFVEKPEIMQRIKELLTGTT